NQLAKLLDEHPLPGFTGIGHTRWATHGAATERNAHPHASSRVALVHNGIIENFRELKNELRAAGHQFESETDTEVAVHLITQYLDEGLPAEAAAKKAVKRLAGAFALVMIFKDEQGLMIAARRGSPLAVGYGQKEAYLGSDAFSLAPFTNRVAYLEDGDVAVVRGADVVIYDSTGKWVARPIHVIQPSGGMVDKGNQRHFMAKEIHEQPEVVGHTISRYVDASSLSVNLSPEMAALFRDTPRITLSACGTAFYAAMVGKYWFEKLARMPVDIDVASELRYRNPVYADGGLCIYVSQSGETADTLAAMRDAKAAGQKVAAIVNVPESSIARDADVVWPTYAGPEIGVASTKAYTCQLAVLASLAIAAARARGRINAAEEQRLCGLLLETPRHMVSLLTQETKIEALGQEIAKAQDVLYLGRGMHFPTALEGALKLKEISYIHAEGYAAGEMKHGPIALIDRNVPVVVIAPHDELFDKTVSNMQEVMARGGKVVLISDRKGLDEAAERTWQTIEVPEADPFIAPILYALPIQLLAYHTAVAKGTDVDQPRNLAKSVTVE
ncbi:MAG TPA: glutamine--fructose-6-phosphate transaminase (isomerizing), partial [Micropepsaceae bacterium]|nr:glutamine--fructose-6-phosphate transaminase (isomerizing) [Micropepsaceae bacterium]